MSSHAVRNLQTGYEEKIGSVSDSLMCDVAVRGGGTDPEHAGGGADKPVDFLHLTPPSSLRISGSKTTKTRVSPRQNNANPSTSAHSVISDLHGNLPLHRRAVRSRG